MAHLRSRVNQLTDNQLQSRSGTNKTDCKERFLDTGTVPEPSTLEHNPFAIFTEEEAEYGRYSWNFRFPVICADAPESIIQKSNMSYDNKALEMIPLCAILPAPIIKGLGFGVV